MLVAICLFVVVGIAAAVFWRANAKACADFWRTSKKGLFLSLVALLLNLLVGCGGNPALPASAHEPNADNSALSASEGNGNSKGYLPPLSAESICANLYVYARVRKDAVEVIAEARTNRGFITVDDMKEHLVVDETNAALIEIYKKLMTRETEISAAERVKSAMLGLHGAALSAYLSAEYALSINCPKEFAILRESGQNSSKDE